MDTMDDRNEFEEYASERDLPQDFSIRKSGGGTGNPLAGTYSNYDIQRHWDTWQSAQQAAKAGEWRPIESAPRDGTWIIGAELNSCGKWTRYITFYTATMPWSEQWLWEHDEESEYCPPGWFKDTSDDEIVTSCKPTHWQPLSAPPPDEEK